MRTPRWVQIITLVIGIAVAYAATPATHWLRNEPPPSGSPLARGLLGKTLVRQWPQNDQANLCGGEFIASATAEADAYLTQVPPQIRLYLLPGYIDYLRYWVVMPELARRDPATSPDSLMMCYALSRVKSDPLYFLGDAAQQFWGLLTYSTFISAAKRAQIGEYLDVHPPVMPLRPPPQDEFHLLRDRALHDLQLTPSVFGSTDVYTQPPRARPPLLSFGMRVLQLTAAALMITGVTGLLGDCLRPGSAARPLLAVGILGVAAFGEMLITAVVESAIPRYVFPLWPLFSASLVLGVVTIWNMLKHLPPTTAERRAVHVLTHSGNA